MQPRGSATPRALDGIRRSSASAACSAPRALRTEPRRAGVAVSRRGARRRRAGNAGGGERHVEARAEARYRGPLAEVPRGAKAGNGGAHSRGLRPGLERPVAPQSTRLVARGYVGSLGGAGRRSRRLVDEAAPAHWSALAPAEEDPLLPAGADPLAGASPAAGARPSPGPGGVVARAGASGSRGPQAWSAAGLALEGDLWRWDGFVAAGEAPTAAARRLREKIARATLSAKPSRSPSGGGARRKRRGLPARP